MDKNLAQTYNNSLESVNKKIGVGSLRCSLVARAFLSGRKKKVVDGN